MSSIHYFKSDAVLTLQALDEALRDLRAEMTRVAEPGQDIDTDRLKRISLSLHVVQKRLRILTDSVDISNVPY